MKHVFRFMAAALIASSMLFVACSKDEDETLEPTPTPTPAAQADGTVITQFQLVGDQNVYVDTLMHVNGWRFVDEDSIYCVTDADVLYQDGLLRLPFIRQVWKIVGDDIYSYDLKYARNFADAQQVAEGNESDVVYTGFYPEWGLNEYVKNGLSVYDIDVTSMTFSYEINAVMGSYMDIMFNGKTVEDMQKANLKVIAKKISFVMNDSKGLKDLKF